MSRVIGITLITCWVGVLFSQADRDFKASYIGLQAGYGYSSVLFDPGAGTGGVVSPRFGASYRFESPRNKSIEIALLYTSTGWTLQAYERTIHALALPVTGHIRFGKGRAQPFITLGETLSYALSDQGSGVDPSNPTIFDEFPIDNKLGFALNGGLGLSLKTGSGMIQFEARATVGLTNLYDRDNEVGFSGSRTLFIDGSLKYLLQMRRKQRTPAPVNE